MAVWQSSGLPIDPKTFRFHIRLHYPSGRGCWHKPYAACGPEKHSSRRKRIARIRQQIGAETNIRDLIPDMTWHRQAPRSAEDFSEQLLVIIDNSLRESTEKARRRTQRRIDAQPIFREAASPADGRINPDPGPLPASTGVDRSPGNPNRTAAPREIEQNVVSEGEVHLATPAREGPLSDTSTVTSRLSSLDHLQHRLTIAEARLQFWNAQYMRTLMEPEQSQPVDRAQLALSIGEAEFHVLTIKLDLKRFGEAHVRGTLADLENEKAAAYVRVCEARYEVAKRSGSITNPGSTTVCQNNR